MNHQAQQTTTRRRLLLLPFLTSLLASIFISHVWSRSHVSSIRMLRRFLSSSEVALHGEHHEVEEEEDEEFDGSALAVIISIILCLIVVTLAFEHFKHHLESSCSEDMELILEKLFGELTVLGFLAMVIFFIHQSGMLDFIAEHIHLEEEELVEYVEHVHFTLFSVMIFFVAQVLVLLKFATETDNEWAAMDKLCRNDVALNRTEWTPSAEERQALQKLRKASWVTRFIPQLFDKSAEQIRDTVIFRALRHEFLLDRSLGPPFRPTATEKQQLDFDFGRYLAIAQSHMLEHVVEVEQDAWLWFAVGTILFYAFAYLVHDNMDILAWMWVGAGWCVYLFNVVFELHLVDLRRSFLPNRIASLLYEPDFVLESETGSSNGNGDDHTASLALLGAEEAGALPAWCDVDPNRYLEYQRPWLVQKLVGGKPNRQQTLFWMDRHGPHLYYLILQMNLIFTGVYTGLLILAFIPDIAAQYSKTTLVIYCILALIPVIGITYNKKRLVGTLAQVTSIGSYRKVRIINDVLRHQKTVNVVRTFIIIYNMRRVQNNSEAAAGMDQDVSERSALGESEQAQVYKTFSSFDTDGSGAITQEELVGLLARIGISSSPEAMSRIVTELDKSGDGLISRDEFMTWYAGLFTRKIPIKDLAEEMFHSLDDNNNGEITIGEFYQKFDGLFGGDLMTLDEISAMIRELDRNRNGTIGLEEFEEFFIQYLPDEMRR